MEAAGIEPASAAAPDRASTGVAHPLISPGRPVVSDLPPGQPSCGLTPPAIGFPSGPARFMTPLPEPRAEFGATRHLISLGGECEFIIRTYVVSRLFYEADRGPRPAAQPENRPRRDLVAPVCVSASVAARSRRPTGPCSADACRGHAADGNVVVKSSRLLARRGRAWRGCLRLLAGFASSTGPSSPC